MAFYQQQLQALSSSMNRVSTKWRHMPYSEGFCYCFKCIDKFTRWWEVIPLENQEVITISRAFYTHWISRFNMPLRIMTDHGKLFDPWLFKYLSYLTGTNHLRTIAYYPSANGMVELSHRQFKTAIKYHQNGQWTELFQQFY